MKFAHQRLAVDIKNVNLLTEVPESGSGAYGYDLCRRLIWVRVNGISVSFCDHFLLEMRHRILCAT
jgi:hypothetical protein